jgi:hypothetical protein
MRSLFDAGARRIGTLELSLLLQTVPEVAGRRTAQPTAPVANGGPTAAPAAPPSMEPAPVNQAPGANEQGAVGNSNAASTDPSVEPSSTSTAQSIDAAARITSNTDLGMSAGLGLSGNLSAQRIAGRENDDSAPTIEMSVERKGSDDRAQRATVDADKTVDEHTEDKDDVDDHSDDEYRSHVDDQHPDVRDADQDPPHQKPAGP